MNRLRFKTFLTFFPIIVAVVIISGFMSFLESKTALTQLANRHMAYKAEQLRDFIHNEWQMIEELDLDDKEKYRAAEEESFRSYAGSLLRSDSEVIFVVDSAGLLLMRMGGIGTPIGNRDGANNPNRVSLPIGWFSQKIFSEDRVGIAFNFEPFAWTIAVTELRSRFFSDVDGILRTHLWILLASVLGATVLSAVYLGYIIGPLERLTGTIEQITKTGNLSYRARIESRDEIGTLAHRFNNLIDTLEAQEVKLSQTRLAEKRALETTVQREVETLYLLGRISDYNDEDTGAHLTRIGSLSGLFSQLLGQSEQDQELIRNSSPLHDIGKIAVPEAILLKPGKLTPDEFEIIKKHTVMGYELLKDSQSRYLAEGALIAYTHHERWDGSGYPRGLAQCDIPLSGRIVSVVDVFDALISDRPYKTAWDNEKALEYIVEQRGKHFDPELVDLFRTHFPLFVSKNQKLAAAQPIEELTPPV